MTIKVGDKLPAGTLQEFIEVEGNGCTVGPNTFKVEDLVIAGETRAGLALLRRSHAERRSPRWRVMMPLFSAMPPLARPLLAWRRRQELAEG